MIDLHSSWRRRATTVGTVLGSAVLAVTAVGVAASSNADPAAAATTAATPKAPSETDRAKLRSALQDARELEGDARRKAVASVWTKARDGAYGDAIEARAERRGDRRLARAALPAGMRHDLATIRKAKDKDAAREELRRKALDGDYGKRVQAAAKRMEGKADGSVPSRHG